MKARIQTPNFDSLLYDYAKKIDDINAAARECVKAGQEIQYQAMKQGLDRHKQTGAALKALVKDPIVQEGNMVRTATGTDIKANRKGFFDGNWQEFGVKPNKSGGKPRFVKDPWFRPAVDGTKSKIRAQWKVIIKRRAGIDTK
jgi:hypothetical protein